MAIMELTPPTTKKQLQIILGKINFLHRFVALLGKIEVFSPLLKLKNQEEFMWKDKYQQVFNRIKEYLSNSLVLMPPKVDRPFKLYLLATDTTIGCMLVKENDEGKEQAIYYLSRMLNDAKIRYTTIVKLCLSMDDACTKLHHYILPTTVHVIYKTDVIKYKLTRPIIRD